MKSLWKIRKTKPEDYNVFDDKDNQIGVSDETKKYNIIMAEQSQFDIQLNLLKELLELFIKGCQEFKDLDYFNLFSEITFTDIFFCEIHSKSSFT